MGGALHSLYCVNCDVTLLLLVVLITVVAESVLVVVLSHGTFYLAPPVFLSVPVFMVICDLFFVFLPLLCNALTSPMINSFYLSV